MKHKQQNEKEYILWKQKKDEEKLIETDTNNNNGVNKRSKLYIIIINYSLLYNYNSNINSIITRIYQCVVM